MCKLQHVNIRVHINSDETRLVCTLGWIENLTPPPLTHHTPHSRGGSILILLGGPSADLPGGLEGMESPQGTAGGQGKSFKDLIVFYREV